MHSGSKCGKTIRKKFGNLEILKMVRVAEHINKPEIIFHLKIILIENIRKLNIGLNFHKKKSAKIFFFYIFLKL